MENEVYLADVDVSSAFVTSEAETLEPTPARVKRRGRPRKYETDAERQEGYARRHGRSRKKKRAITPPDPTCTDPAVWDAFLRTQGLGMSAGTHMSDGKGEDGLLETGGYDTEEIARVDSEHESKEHGKRKSTTNFDLEEDD
jgi:hypothetical protein